MSKSHEDLSQILRAPEGIDVRTIDPSSTPGFPGQDKDDVAALLEKLQPTLSERQECLFAQGRTSDAAPRVLLVLQGMDTSGKGGVIRHSIGLVDPQGVHIKAFKAPTEEERQHDFLWRIRKEIPAPGMIGIFDRSHYEDVLIARVNHLVPEEQWRDRYRLINEFEQELTDQNVHVLKCYLHISPEKQKERLLERLDDPTKHWKYNESDLESRAHWPEYMLAYNDALRACNPDHAPWYVVPSDRKWYRNWAIATLLCDKLTSMGLSWPTADFDVAAQRQKVEAS